MTVRIREDSAEPRVMPQMLNAVSDMMQNALIVAAQRDRYHDALAVIADAPYGEMTGSAMQRIAREALESRR